MAIAPAAGAGAAGAGAAGAGAAGAVGGASPAIGRTANGLQSVDDVITQITKDTEKLARVFSGKWIEMQDIAFKTARSMGLSREMAMRYDRQLMQTTKDLARQYGITAKEIADFQKAYTEATGRNVILTRQQTESLAALQKIAGNVSVTELVDEFDKVGVGVTRATANIGLLQERAKALGISPAKATKMMADNIKLAASYSFKNGVADIEKMAMRATSLRMDMNAVMTASEKFSNIEDAISTAANIQMLGGSFAQQFSNPMGAMYESMADPKAFMERLERTIAGKGRYDSKTGEVKFDPITMMQMKEMAKQLGISVDKLTNPAMAKVQNDVVEKELRAAGTWGKWTEVEQQAIQNLSRTNVDEKTGKHYITITDENGEEHREFIENLSKEELQIAQDRQMSEEGLFKDVQDIKDILDRTLGRARGTTSTKENITGLKEEIGSFFAQLQNLYMPLISGGLNGNVFRPWDWVKLLSGGNKGGGIDLGSHATEGIFDNFWSNKNYAFAEGGIVEPLPHAAMGTIVPGDSYMGDKTPVMANAGEMVLNQREQKGLFDLLKNIALTGTMIWGGNKLGRHFGMRGLGTNAAIGGLLSGGGLGVGSMLGTGTAMFMGNKMMGGMMPMGMRMSPIQRLMGGQAITLMNPNVVMDGNTVMNGNIGDGTIVDNLEDAALAAADLGTTSRSLSLRMRELSKRSSLLGKSAKLYMDMHVGRRRLGRRLSRNIKAGANWVGNRKWIRGIRDYNRFIGDSYYDSSVGRYRTHGKFVGKAKIGNFATKGILRSKGFFKSLGKDLSLLKGNAAQATEAAAKATEEAAKTGGKLAKVGGSVAKAGGGILKGAGKIVKPLGAVLAVGSAINGISNARSQYDAQVDEIESSGASELEKARAKDRAAREKNANIGDSVGGAAGMAAGTAIGATLGSAVPVVGTIIGGAIGGWLGEKAGSFLGKGIGGLFGGDNEEKFKKEQEKLFGQDGSKGGNEELLKVVKSIDSKMPGGRSITAKTLSMTALGPLMPLGISASSIKALPDIGIFKKVAPTAAGEKGQTPTSIGKTDINLNVSGTIKLEGGGKSVDFDLAKLIDTPEFKRQLADIVTRRINENSNNGKRNMESERNNMASQYNKSGK